MDIMELLRARRSIRAYTAQPIEPQKLELLKEAVLRSPSSRNIDPGNSSSWMTARCWRSSPLCKPHGADFLADAALGIVVCGDSRASDTWIEDCAIASILVQMVAQSIGLGSCWVQVRNRMFDGQTTSEQYIQMLLQTPEHIKVESIIAIGHPAESGSRFRVRTSRIQDPCECVSRMCGPSL